MDKLKYSSILVLGTLHIRYRRFRVFQIEYKEEERVRVREKPGELLVP